MLIGLKFVKDRETNDWWKEVYDVSLEKLSTNMSTHSEEHTQYLAKIGNTKTFLECRNISMTAQKCS